jgi:hypothetical protein
MHNRQGDQANPHLWLAGDSSDWFYDGAISSRNVRILRRSLQHVIIRAAGELDRCSILAVVKVVNPALKSLLGKSRREC